MKEIAGVSLSVLLLSVAVKDVLKKGTGGLSN
jgi:hypothetical protein